jgi:hypothetical protein
MRRGAGSGRRDEVVDGVELRWLELAPRLLEERAERLEEAVQRLLRFPIASANATAYWLLATLNQICAVSGTEVHDMAGLYRCAVAAVVALLELQGHFVRLAEAQQRAHPVGPVEALH